MDDLAQKSSTLAPKVTLPRTLAPKVTVSHTLSPQVGKSRTLASKDVFSRTLSPKLSSALQGPKSLTPFRLQLLCLTP